MITVLHGDDIFASYSRLQIILGAYANFQKVNVGLQNADELENAIYTQDLLGSKKVIIAQDLISSKKIQSLNLSDIPHDQDIIFWEKKEIPASNLNKFKSFATIEQFKPAPDLFKFLDSIGGNSKTLITLLSKVQREKTSIFWHLENRLMLLVFAKLTLSRQEAEVITGKRIHDWQWQKILSQARMLKISYLLQLLSSSLQIETMIKTGKAAQNEKTLLELMFLKAQ